MKNLQEKELLHTQEVVSELRKQLSKEKANSEYWKDVACKASKDRTDFFIENCQLASKLQLTRIAAVISLIGFLIMLLS